MEVEGAQKKPQKTAITGQDIPGGTNTIVLEASIKVTWLLKCHCDWDNANNANHFVLFVNVRIYNSTYSLDCKTVSGKKCVFPFIYRPDGLIGKKWYEYNRCTTFWASHFWCATKVDGQGYYQETDRCDGCPGEEQLLHTMLVSACSYSYLMHA